MTAAIVLTVAVGHSAGQSVGESAGPENGVALIELLASQSLSCAFAGVDDPAATLTVELSEIDIAGGAAAGGDPVIEGDVRIMPTSLGLHFYQFTTDGELSLITVSALGAADGGYLAVLSRHHVESEALEPTQLSGTCTATPETR